VLPGELADLLDAADPAAREAAWKTFLETHSRLLLHTARTLGRDYDATMDAYAYLLEQLRCDDFHRLRAYTVRSRCKFTTWLVVVARRLCLDRVRQRYGRQHGAGQQSHDAQGARRRLVDLLAEELDASELADPTADNPETELRANELNRALLSALMGLEPRDRLLLKLRFADGLGAREIGHVMGFTTPFHVYRRLNTLLRGLRTALARRGVQDSEP
jgi:RNA polymerase sigma factor (sigma-70 family)